MSARADDTNHDGTVDFTDFTILGSELQRKRQRLQGNFDYDPGPITSNSNLSGQS